MESLQSEKSVSLESETSSPYRFIPGAYYFPKKKLIYIFYPTCSSYLVGSIRILDSSECVSIMTVSNLVTGHKLLVVTLGTSLSHHTGDFDGFSQIHLQIFPALLCENIFRHLDTVICKGISKQLA